MKTALNLDALLVLDAIARSHSFAAAAEELHRVPSSVTYAIQKLENSLKVKLFDRNGHRATLTTAGEALLRDGRHLLSMADGIERNIRRIDTGWESEFRVAASDLLPLPRLLQLCEEFYQVAPDTRLSITTEVLAGTWDALLSGRADFVLGAPGEGPPGGGYTTHPLGEVEFVFAIAPGHPLVNEDEPLTNHSIRQYRAVAAADSSRSLPSRTFGLLPGQNVLTVPTLAIKVEAQKQGLGIGYLPRHLIEEEIKNGQLVIRDTEDGHSSFHSVCYAWRSNNRGKVLEWFRRRLTQNQTPFNWFGPKTE